MKQTSHWMMTRLVVEAGWGRASSASMGSCLTLVTPGSVFTATRGGVVGGVGGSKGDAARDAEGEAAMEDGLVADLFLDGVGDDLDTELEDDD